MDFEWFKTRGYKHFDAPVGLDFAGRTASAKFVERHSWLPLVHYTKRTKRYKPVEGRTVFKDRPIMYASHRDACILSRYAARLTALLDELYERQGLGDSVIAYRKLGRSNYNFSADAYRFAQSIEPCVVLCFDISGFLDHLDHRILKDRLKRILGAKELPRDWYAVFRHVTRYSNVSRDDLARHPLFGHRLKLKTCEPVATTSEVTSAGVPINKNANCYGIPQGTPISSALSNLYMIEVDIAMADTCRQAGALYQRYSDDILIVCRLSDETTVTSTLQSAISSHLLRIRDDKTERKIFDHRNPTAFQYLGFNISPEGAVIRPGSMSRQWRKARRSIARTKKAGRSAIAAGRADKIYTKKLWRRFLPVGVRNFSSYARRSAKAFGSPRIVRQVLRLERMVDRAIRQINEEP